MFRRTIAALSVAALVLLAAGPVSATKTEPSWEFVDIARAATALGIIDRNQVVGWVGEYYYTSHAFIWDGRVGLEDLHDAAELPVDTFSVAHDMNNQGTVVGWRIGGYDTLVWDERAGLVDVSPGFMSDMANAINSSGQIVGGGSGLPAFMWESRHGYQVLTPLPGTTTCEAIDINDRGQVAGRCGSNAVIWQPDGTVEDLGTFGEEWVLVTGINNPGQVIGTRFGYQLYNRGFLWDPHRGAVDLGENFQPEAINDSGDIAGRMNTVPALLDSNGELALLPIPEGFQSYGRATDINNRGVIVGYLPDQDGVEHAVMWVPSA